jgi:hypothetical protein
MGQVRRDVARILTVLRQREIAESAGTFVAPTAEQQAAARANLAAADEAARATKEPVPIQEVLAQREQDETEEDA